jgi:hypothetical protein
MAKGVWHGCALAKERVARAHRTHELECCLRIGQQPYVINHRSHFGSRYTLGCCGHAGLLCFVLPRMPPPPRVQRHVPRLILVALRPSPRVGFTALTHAFPRRGQRRPARRLAAATTLRREPRGLRHFDRACGHRRCRRRGPCYSCDGRCCGRRAYYFVCAWVGRAAGEGSEGGGAFVQNQNSLCPLAPKVSPRGLARSCAGELLWRRWAAGRRARACAVASA